MPCHVMHRWSRHDDGMETWRKQLRKSPALAFQDSTTTRPISAHQRMELGCLLDVECFREHVLHHSVLTQSVM